MMCECGCTQGNATYILPGPKGTVYLLIFQPACVECDGPDAVIVQRWPSRRAVNALYGEPVPALPLMPCPSGWDEAVISTGTVKSEFIAALREHLVGLDSADFTDGDGTALDAIAADELLDEMYGAATFTPRLVMPEPQQPNQTGEPTR